jgi:hypothetical protein
LKAAGVIQRLFGFNIEAVIFPKVFSYGSFVKPTALPAEYGFTEWFRELVATALCNKFSCKEDQFFGKTNAPKTNIKNAPTASQ